MLISFYKNLCYNINNSNLLNKSLLTQQLTERINNMIDLIEMSYTLTDKYYMMLETENDLLVSTLEETQKKSSDDIDLMLELDIMICNLNILKRISIDIQESNLLQLSSHTAKTIKDLLSNCIDTNDSMSDAERIDLQMIRDHVDRDCTLVITKQR